MANGLNKNPFAPCEESAGLETTHLSRWSFRRCRVDLVWPFGTPVSTAGPCGFISMRCFHDPTLDLDPLSVLWRALALDSSINAAARSMDELAQCANKLSQMRKGPGQEPVVSLAAVGYS